jgi:pimeloyl-ACP methyl ester carboxylesterase
VPDTQYARCGDLSLAYQVFGSGPVNIVVSGSFVTNVEVLWTSPEYKAFFDHLASFARVLIFDKAGVGMSDPVAKVRTLEERVTEIEALMDTVGFEQAALLGFSEGGAASILFAATRPERTRGLVIVGSTAINPVPVTLDWEDVVDMEPSMFVEYLGKMLGDAYTPSEQQVARLQHVGRAVRDSWGTGEAMSLFMPSVRSRQQLGMIERVSASPGMARATLTAMTGLDLRAVLPTLRVPTLVIHATDDVVPVQLGRYLADCIPGARMLEVPGSDHAPWLYEGDLTVDTIEEFLTGSQPRIQTQRALRTILFTDIVGSTERAAAMGDERWHALLDRHDDVTRSTVELHGGQVVKNTGDGHLATLVMAQAAPSEIMVSSTVRDLVTGSGIGFDDRGVHALKGVPGEWRLLAVDRAGASPTSREGRLAAQPTPAMSEGLRRSDRAAAVVARRAPSVLRGFARLSSRASS